MLVFTMFGMLYLYNMSEDLRELAFSSLISFSSVHFNSSKLSFSCNIYIIGGLPLYIFFLYLISKRVVISRYIKLLMDC